MSQHSQEITTGVYTLKYCVDLYIHKLFVVYKFIINTQPYLVVINVYLSQLANTTHISLCLLQIEHSDIVSLSLLFIMPFTINI